MAFHDILQALVADADAQIARARAAKEEAVAHARERLERDASDKCAALATEVARKKKNMERQILAHTQMQGRLSAATAKHALMEETYDAALDSLVNMNPAQTEVFLKGMINTCPEDGTLRPAQTHETIVKKLAGSRTVGSPIKARGGFVHEAASSERDCTYETLVHNILRPATELAVASTLFRAA